MEGERGGGERETMKREQFSWGREVEEDGKVEIQPAKQGKKEDLPTRPEPVLAPAWPGRSPSRPVCPRPRPGLARRVGRPGAREARPQPGLSPARPASQTTSISSLENCPNMTFLDFENQT